MKPRHESTVLLALATLALAACSGAAVRDHDPTVADEQLLSENVFARPSLSPSRSVESVFAVSPGMRQFLRENVASSSTERTFGDLIDAMESFGIRYLVYDNRTLTASEAFLERRGNCLTFTNMFLVMAREVGLRAQFQEVRIPPDWIQVGNTMVLRRHINVRVLLGGRVAEGMGERVVDFGDESIPASLIDTANRVISDQRALAHFYNNWAAESLQQGDEATAFEYLRHALTEGDREFSPAWNLVGVLYQHAGREDLAEQAFLRALKAEPGEISVMSNLQRLYERQGRGELSDYYQGQVTRHRMKNPYFRFAEARKAYGEGDYRTAIVQLRKAIRLKPDDSDFYYLLGDSYMAAGDRQRAAHYHAIGDRLVEAMNAMTEAGAAEPRRLVKPKVPRETVQDRRPPR